MIQYENMIIVVGLGNPEKKFEKTRHNVGFSAINKIADNFHFPNFNFQSSFNAEISQGKIAEKKVILVKPYTFMNNSGIAVKKIINYYKISNKNLIIIHDDIDLPVGRIKIVRERGSAGHKGVESIIKNISNKGLIRLRIGISPTKDTDAGKIVLKNFSSNEERKIKEALKKTSLAIELFVKEGIEKTMNEFNK